MKLKLLNGLKNKNMDTGDASIFRYDMTLFYSKVMGD